MGPARRVRGADLGAVFARVKGETVLFSISDRPAQEALGIWRELN